MAKRWYVVQTKAAQEQLAVTELNNQSFKTFYPTYIKTKVHKRTQNKTHRVLPVFPSYVFVQFDATKEKWKCINNTKGCVGLVGYSENYISALPKGCIEELMERLEDGHIPLEKSLEAVIEFHPGMELGIKNPAYEGITASYCSHTRTRVTLLMALLNRQVQVTVPIDAVFPVHSE